MINTSSLFVDRAGMIRPDLIPLAAFLCAEEYDDYARSLILDDAAAVDPLRDLTIPAPGSDGWRFLKLADLAGAEEVLARGGPAPAVESAEAPAPAPIAGAAPSLADLVAAEADRLRLVRLAIRRLPGRPARAGRPARPLDRAPRRPRNTRTGLRSGRSRRGNTPTRWAARRARPRRPSIGSRGPAVALLDPTGRSLPR